MAVDMTTLRPELEPLPARMRGLVVHRGYPTPFFVAWQNGAPEFRAMDPDKLVRCIQERLCWVCGEPLGVHLVFVVGPMCGLNRISAEAPCHLDCARWSCRNCPFLSRPHAHRRDSDLVEGEYHDAPGLAIKRNPGVTLLWTARSYSLIQVGHGVLFQLGEPTATEWWAEGKPASREQVAESVETGLPLLQVEAACQADLDTLQRARTWLETRYPT